MFYLNNKKVLLRERKRHTDRRVASTRYAVLVGGGTYLGGWVPTLGGGGGTYPRWGGTYPGWGVPTLGRGVPTLGGGVGTPIQT